MNVRVARFIGAPHSTLADVVATRHDATLVIEPLLLNAIARHGLLDLFALAPDGNLAGFTPSASRVPRAQALVLDLGRGWEAVYEEKTSSKRRGLHRRRWRQLREAGPVELRVASSESEFEQALEEAFRIHALRWRGRHDVSTFSGGQGMQFHREALGALARRGHARIVLLQLSGRPIAFTCCLSLAGGMFLYRLGFDPGYAQFSPGILTTHESIRMAAEAGATRVEFLRGSERYKRELADRTDTLTQAVLGDGSLVNGASARILRGATRLKRARSARRVDLRSAVEAFKRRRRK
jgi:CelD/BcsL family acetyltransferase involved in cellulose biosynthesis